LGGGRIACARARAGAGRRACSGIRARARRVALAPMPPHEHAPCCRGCRWRGPWSWSPPQWSCVVWCGGGGWGRGERGAKVRSIPRMTPTRVGSDRKQQPPSPLPPRAWPAPATHLTTATSRSVLNLASSALPSSLALGWGWGGVGWGGVGWGAVFRISLFKTRLWSLAFPGHLKNHHGPLRIPSWPILFFPRGLRPRTPVHHSLEPYLHPHSTYSQPLQPTQSFPAQPSFCSPPMGAPLFLIFLSLVHRKPLTPLL
jgi:hypothetical protein